MFDLPVVKIEVQHMRQTVMAALRDYSGELSRKVNDELERAIAEYPFEDEIVKITRAIINDAIQKSVERYFKYGEGSELIDRFVADAIRSSVNGSET